MSPKKVDGLSGPGLLQQGLKRHSAETVVRGLPPRLRGRWILQQSVEQHLAGLPLRPAAEGNSEAAEDRVVHGQPDFAGVPIKTVNNSVGHDVPSVEDRRTVRVYQQNATRLHV